MKWFRSSSEPTITPRPPKVELKPKVEAKPVATPPARPPVVEGWSESELVGVYNAAPVRNLKTGDRIFADAEETESFYVLLEGALEVVVKLNGQPGRPGIFQRGDVVAPMPKSHGFSYDAQAITPATIIEIPPAVMKHLPDRTQLSIFKVTVASTSRINTYIRSVNGDMNSKNARLSQYVENLNRPRAAFVQTDFVLSYLRNLPRIPAYATDLAAKLLDDRTSVQEVVEGIKRDPNLVGVVLKTVNSTLYGFDKKIESFYHACMILGFNNIYNLIMREATLSTMPVNRDTTRVHKHSCLMSVLCFEIASGAKEQQSQTLSTIGLLHDIGKAVQVIMKAAHPDKSDFIDMLPSANLGAELLRTWGIPERICKIVEFQQYPEFNLPDNVPSEFNRETGTLHVAHVLEHLLVGQPIDPSRDIYTQDYMNLLGYSQWTPERLLKERVVPSLVRNRNRIPPEIQYLFTKTPVEVKQD
jgi:HD-like signal output (HDOD) protein